MTERLMSSPAKRMFGGSTPSTGVTFKENILWIYTVLSQEPFHHS